MMMAEYSILWVRTVYYESFLEAVRKYHLPSRVRSDQGKMFCT